MARTKQTARKSTGGKAPRRVLASKTAPSHTHSFVVNIVGERRETKERRDFVASNISDITVKLSNQDLRLWKSLLQDSVISVSSDGVHLLEEESFRVESKILLQFLLEKSEARIDVFQNSIHHYYLFFKKIGMKHQMSLICDIVDDIDDFTIAFEVFTTLVLQCDETEKIKQIFETLCEPLNLKVTDFQHALTLKLFRRMHDLYINGNSFQSRPELFKIPNVSKILLQIVQFEQQRHTNPVSTTNHPDFWNSRTRILTNSQKLHNLRGGIRSNMKLRTCDGGSFDVHKEIIVYRSNFFFRMFEFGGSEMEQLELKNFISLESTTIRNQDMLKAILDYIYKDTVTATNWKILLPLLQFTDQYGELNFKKMVLDKMFFLAITKGELVDVIESVGDVLRKQEGFNEELLRILLPRFKHFTKVTESELKLMIDKSFQTNQLFGRVEKIERENSTLKEKIEEMNIEIGELKNTVSELVAKKRKRGKDDRNARKERRQKRRKIDRNNNDSNEEDEDSVHVKKEK